MPGYVRGCILEDSGSVAHGARDTCKGKTENTSWRSLALEPPGQGHMQERAHPEGISLLSTIFGPISIRLKINVGPSWMIHIDTDTQARTEAYRRTYRQTDTQTDTDRHR